MGRGHLNMSQESEESRSPSEISPQRPEIANGSSNNGVLSRTVRPLDDKAARLEQQLERIERKSANEKFIVSAIAIIVFLAFISVYVPGYAFSGIFMLCIILLLAMAFHWEFPQIVLPLTNLFYFVLKSFAKKTDSSPSADETER